MYDFNVKLRNSDRERITLLKRATELGWNSIAWNLNIVGKINTAKCKIPNIVTIPRADLEEVLATRKLVTSNVESVTQLNRITITIDDMSDVQAITSGNEVLKLFDIVAVCPGNAKIFSYLCKTADVDLISVDFSHKVPFPINKKLLDEAIKRGIQFELVYGPMLQTAAIRREMISGTRVFLQFLRGKNLIISSGCDTINALRGPYDVINIGEILKLTQSQAANAINGNCATLLKHSTARKLKFLPLEVTTADEYIRQSSMKRKSADFVTNTKDRKNKLQKQYSSDRDASESDNDDIKESSIIDDRNQEDDGVWQF